MGIAATCGSPKGFPGGGRCGGGEAAGALAPRQDAGRVPFEGGSRVSGVRLIITPGKFGRVEDRRGIRLSANPFPIPATSNRA